MAHEELDIPGEGVFSLPKSLVGFHNEILSRLARHPYDRNVFLMMRFRDSNEELSKFMIELLENHGLKGIRADHPEWNITQNVYNPIAVLYCCKYGIALFDEPEEGQTFNPNVVYELGIMQSQRKNCLILKHRSLPQVPFDLIKDLHREYGRDLDVRKAIAQWLAEISPLARPEPVGTPRLVSSSALADQASLAARGLVELAPRLGEIDLAAFFANAKLSIDLGFPLSRVGLPQALDALREFKHRKGIARFVFMDPETAFVKDESPQEGPFTDNYAADLERLTESMEPLVGRGAKATVKLYLHSFPSGYSLFRSDTRMIVSPWNDGLEPEESPCLVLEKREDGQGLFASYLAIFEGAIHRKSARLIWTNKI